MPIYRAPKPNPDQDRFDELLKKKDKFLEYAKEYVNSFAKKKTPGKNDKIFKGWTLENLGWAKAEIRDLIKSLK